MSTFVSRTASKSGRSRNYEWQVPRQVEATAGYAVNESMLRQIAEPTYSGHSDVVFCWAFNGDNGWPEGDFKSQSVVNLVVHESPSRSIAAKKIASAEDVINASVSEGRYLAFWPTPKLVNRAHFYASRNCREGFLPALKLGLEHAHTRLVSAGLQRTINHAGHLAPLKFQCHAVNQVYSASVSQNRLKQQILEALQRAYIDLDTEGKAVAADAIKAGFAFAHALGDVELEARVFVTDDGLIGMQWRRDHEGVLVSVGANGESTYSIKKLGGSYSSNIVQFDAYSGVPGELRDAISQFTEAGQSILSATVP